MSPIEHPKFCPNCGIAAADSTVCACGHRLAAADSTAHQSITFDTTQVPFWFQAVGRRIIQTLTLQPETQELPFGASVLSTLMRGLILALLCDRWISSVMQELRYSVVKAFGMFGALIPEMKTSLFGWLLLGFIAAAAAGLLLTYFIGGKERFVSLTTILSDAQWPVVVGTLGAWLCSSVWAPLSLVLFAGSICWGQSLLGSGFARLIKSRRRQVLLQGAIGAVSVVILLYFASKGLQSAMLTPNHPLKF